MLSSQDIEVISSNVCRDMLGLNFEVDSPSLSRPLPLQAAVRISGDYDAIVEVSTTSAAATAVTSVMCGLGPDNIGEQDLADALGEIVNIIGGNIKGALPGETTLSLPCVNLENSSDEPLSNGSTVFADFLLVNEPFRVRLSKSPRA